MRARRGFTLIELLVVIAIIAILSGLVVGAMRAVRISTQRTKTIAQLKNLQTALSMYDNEYRKLPRLAPITDKPEDLYRDDGPALYAALMNRPNSTLGGGRNAPYLDWQDGIGIMTDVSKLEADTMGKDGVTGVRPLEGEELTDRHYPTFQRRHLPGGDAPLVFLDHWGNPIHYREWESVASRTKEALHQNPPLRTGFESNGIGETPLPGPIRDVPRDPHGYDLWSNGPNGVNEYMAPGSDDISLKTTR